MQTIDQVGVGYVAQKQKVKRNRVSRTGGRMALSILMLVMFVTLFLFVLGVANTGRCEQTLQSLSSDICAAEMRQRALRADLATSRFAEVTENGYYPISEQGEMIGLL